MLIEASLIKNLPVIDSDQNKLGLIDALLFDGDKGSLIDMRMTTVGVLKKYYVLDYRDTDVSSQQAVAIENKELLKEDLVEYDQVSKRFGKVIGVKASTQSGRALGRVEDLIIELESGLIVRIVLRNYLMERIIPRQFLVSITPKEVIFQDIVAEPTFDKMASGELSPPTNS